MLWRIRTELADRPGALAELAARFGADEIDLLSLEVFTAEAGLVVSAGAGWNAERLVAAFAEAGCSGTTVRLCRADVLTDGPTRYLRSVLRLLDDPCAVDEEIERLQGFDEYTTAEWARVDVLVEIAGRLAAITDTVTDTVQDLAYGRTRGSSDHYEQPAAGDAAGDHAFGRPEAVGPDVDRCRAARGHGAAGLV